MSIKLKPITEKSWLVISDIGDATVGLLTEAREQYSLMAKGEKHRFLNRKEVNKFFNADVFNTIAEPEVESEVKKDYFINGFPVEFDNPCEVLVKGNKLPLFSKKASSDVYYSAGYYCLNFPKNWMPAYCPKLATLQAYEYAGPFTTELEMRTQLALMRKDKNSKK